MASVFTLIFVANLGFCAAFLMIIMASVLTLFGDFDQANIFVIHALVIILPATLALIALRGQPANFRHNSRMVLYVASWPIFALICTPVLISLTGESFATSFFRALSAMTTTTTKLAPININENFAWGWLSLIAWSGGLLTIIGTVAFVSQWIRSQVGGNLAVQRAHDLQRLESNLLADLPSSLDKNLIARAALIYFAVTVLGGALLLITGLSPSSAGLLALNGVSTSGFRGASDSLFGSMTVVHWAVLSLIVLFGSSSYVLLLPGSARLHDRFGARNWTVWLWPLLVLIGLYMVVDFHPDDQENSRFRLLIMTIGLLSTSGLALDVQDFSLVPLSFLALVLAIGGYSYSTTGGMKVDSIVLMASRLRRVLLVSIYPHASVSKFKLSSQQARLNFANIRALFVLFLVTWLVGTTLFALELSLEASMAAAISALSNAGDLYFALASSHGWPGWLELSSGSRALLGTLMMIGRLELVLAIVPLVRFLSR